LPPLDSSGLRYFVTTYTIAYDRFIRNYKIIALSLCPRNKKKIIEVNVHTLDTDYWRKVQDFPYHVLKQGIFVSDTVNWLIYEPRDIVSFDLNKESYQQLLQPPYEEFSFPTYNLLGVLRDCLCIFSNSCKFSDIWMMKEYGNANSWTKLLRVPYIGDFQCYAYTKPLYLYEDDRVLMRFLDINKYILAIYDSKNNTSKTHEIQRNRHAWHIPNVYVESLISPFLQH
jgi:F-box interacting protein